MRTQNTTASNFRGSLKETPTTRTTTPLVTLGTPRQPCPSPNMVTPPVLVGRVARVFFVRPFRFQLLHVLQSISSAEFSQNLFPCQRLLFPGLVRHSNSLKFERRSNDRHNVFAGLQPLAQQRPAGVVSSNSLVRQLTRHQSTSPELGSPSARAVVFFLHS